MRAAPGRSITSCRVSRYSKHFQGRADPLLKDVVDIREALDGFIEHHQRQPESGEGRRLSWPRSSPACRASGQQQNDGERAEDFDDRRSHSLLGDIPEIAGLRRCAASRKRFDS